MIGYEKGDRLKGERVVIIFKKATKFSLIKGSSRHRARSTTFKGDVKNPVLCIIEDIIHKPRK